MSSARHRQGSVNDKGVSTTKGQGGEVCTPHCLTTTKVAIRPRVRKKSTVRPPQTPPKVADRPPENAIRRTKKSENFAVRPESDTKKCGRTGGLVVRQGGYHVLDCTSAPHNKMVSLAIICSPSDIHMIHMHSFFCSKTFVHFLSFHNDDFHEKQEM